LAKFLNKWLQGRLSLPNTYVTYNSTTLAHDLTKIKITESSRLATFDIKDLYVNIPIEETVHITKVLLENNKINDNTLSQACLLLETIMKQNYLQFDQNIYQPRKGIAMGSPISGLIAEIFLQYYEQHIVKNNLDSNIITYYNRYVDDILVIYDSQKTNINNILNFMNSLHKGLEFKATEETNGNISFLDLMITRAHNTLSINIYRKPTTTDLTIHYKSNHPLQHKTAAYRYMLNRLHNLPLSKIQKQQELNNILYIARQNGYPFTLINKLNKNILNHK
jgi:hypothetical protein